MAIEDEGLEDLIAISDEEYAEERKKQKKKTIITILRNIMIFVTIIAVGFAVYIGVNRYQDNQREQERIAAEQARDRVPLQVVNMEQVHWADQTCALLNSWQQREFPLYQQPADPVVARNDMVNSLRANAEMMDDQSEKLSLVPVRAHIQALGDVESVSMTDNIQNVVKGERESGTAEVSQTISAALTSYSHSLEDMSDDLENLADYDFGGIRTSFIRVPTMLEKMNDQLKKDITEAWDISVFDNAVTLDAVRSLESCNENIVTTEYITQEHGEELRVQKSVREKVTTQRCQDFIKNTSEIRNLSKDAVDVVNECESYMEETIVDPDGLLINKVIEGTDHDIALPEIVSTINEDVENNEESLYTDETSTTSDVPSSPSQEKPEESAVETTSEQAPQPTT